MKWKGQIILIISQIVVILAFLTGMLLNYYAFIPILDEWEETRLTADIDELFTQFITGYDVSNKSQMDSIVNRYDPYGAGDVVIMNTDAEILYSNYGRSGNGYDVLLTAYGKRAEDLLWSVQYFPTGKSKMEYEMKSTTSMYSNYFPDGDKLFFYAVDYRITGSDLMEKWYYLLLFMLTGGVTLVIISFFIVRKIIRQVHIESLSQQELDTAARIQTSMLPRGEKHLIQIDVDARLLPAKKVAGDFYSYVLVDGLFYFCIGDVSGKGVPASLFMSKAVTLFLSYANAGLSVKEMADKLNSELCIANDQNMFLTGIVGIIRAYDGQITYVNAGHEPPIIWDGSSKTSLDYLESKRNIPFGVLEDSEYQENIYVIPKNGLMMVYTDGVSEARSKKNLLLGRGALLNMLDPVKSMSSKNINDHLLRCISKFEAGAEQSDDITLLTFRNILTPKILLIENRISELKKIAPFLSDIFKECPVNKKDYILIRSGLDEALTNCVRYAYDAPGNTIEVTSYMESGRILFIITDSGKLFNPLDYVPEPSSEGLKIGGLGISIFRANFDEVIYNREGDKNILKLIKKL